MGMFGGIRGHGVDSLRRSCAARLARSRDQYRVRFRRTRTLLKRDKERYVRSLAEEVDSFKY